MRKINNHIAAALIAAILGTSAGPCRAQIDPESRSLLQLGFNSTVDGRGPLTGYVYYYRNWPRTRDQTVRMALAPTYLDVELGLKRALGSRVDLGLGLAGGGLFESYAEIRDGRYLRGESFTGHGAKASVAAYADLGKWGPAPLAGILRGVIRHARYIRDPGTEPGFQTPRPQTDFEIRSGLRWGGMEPLMLPQLAGELSLWYEGRLRTASGTYGYASDRRIEPHSHMFWSRALMIYNLPRAEHRFSVQAVAGTSRRSDRFSAYRLGGVLPMAAEFPLWIPGYYYQEISAESFGLLGGSYFLPLSADRKTWMASLTAATAAVDYARGLEEGKASRTGVGTGLAYSSNAWQALVEYGYGINAVRGHGNGAHSISLRVQFDFRHARSPLSDGAPGILRRGQASGIIRPK
jgi:hypothetical protein